MKTLRQILTQPYTPLSRTVLGFMVFLILLSVSVLPFEITKNSTLLPFIQGFEIFVVAVFTIEYILRIISSKNPIKYIFSFWGIIDALAVIPFYLPLLGISLIPAVFGPLRVLRILKFARLYSGTNFSYADAERYFAGHLYEPKPDERLLLVTQKHPALFYLGMLNPLVCMTLGFYMISALSGAWMVVFSAAFFLSGLLFFRINWTDYLHDILAFTTHRVVVQNKELFGVWHDDAPFDKLGSAVPEKTSALISLIGAGTVVLKTVSMGIVRFTGAPKYTEICDKIMDQKRQYEMQNQREY